MAAIPGIKGFPKGESGNPKGKPKGAYSNIRKKFMVMRYMAADKAEEAFGLLWKDFLAGDSMAKQIYFKELAYVPKEWMNEINLENIPKKINSAEDISSLLARLTERLVEVDSLPFQEVIEVMKVLKNNSIQINDNVPVKQLTREELFEEITMLREIQAFRAEESKVKAGEVFNDQG